jgi:hypothetical protein
MLADAAALCAALLAATSPAGRHPAVEVRPATLVLGSGGSARVRVRSGVAPRLVTSAGRLGPARQVEPGVFEAVLEPPKETYPQLALVAALGPDGVGYAWMPLVGRGVAVARTAPHASVSVSIRDRVFGPARADERGVAQIPVVVPPGVRFAYQREKALDLKVPPLRRAQIVLDRRELRADRAEEVTVYAFAATPDGAAWAGAPLAVSVSAGELGPAQEIGPGAIAARWSLPPGAAGAVSVEARLPDVPVAREEVVRAAGPPAGLALALAAERAVAGGPPVDVSVRISDAAGNATDGAVSLRVTGGIISAPERAAPGLVRAALRAPERLEGRSEVVVEAALGPLAERRAVPLLPAAASSIEVTLLRPELTADGGASSEVRVSLRDRFGNGVDVPAPELEAARGRLEPLSREGPGVYHTRYAPRWLREGGEDTVVARAGDLVAREPVRLLAPPRRLGATARAGALHAFGGFTAPYVDVAVEAWPLRLGGAFGLSLGLGRAGTSRDARVDPGGGVHVISASSELWPLEVTALARRRLARRLTGIAGAGARLVGIHGTVALDGHRTADEWGWAGGAHGQAGLALELPSWHARVRADVRVAWQQDPGMRTFRGDLGTVALAVGLTHDAL